MRIAELYEPRRFRLVDGTLEDPAPGQVQARVEAVGLCGSDLHYFTEGGIGDTLCHYPMVLGHEPTGVIVKTGPGVSGWSPGDRVALEPAIYCYHCEYCLTGRHHLCADIRFMSMPGDPGFFREHVNVPSTNLLPLPGNLGFPEGTLHEPLAIILHSIKLMSLRAGETAAVFGAGPIGLLTVAALKLCGAGRVWSIEPVEHRRALAKLMGADAVLDPAAVDPVRQILGDTGERGVDIAIDCAAKGGTINRCVNIAANGGRVVITGIPSETHISLEYHPVRRKEIPIITVRRSNHDSETALAILREKASLFAPLITHTRPMDEIQPVFEMLEQYGDGVGKAVLQLSR